MSESYKSMRRQRRFSMIFVPLVWLGGWWAMSEFVGRGWFRLEPGWAYVAGAVLMLVCLPLAAMLLLVLVPVLYQLFTGKRVDWK